MTTSTPTISVAMVTYNHERFIADSIRSILNQTFADFELVIVDDGSTDGTAQVIATFDDPRIVSIRQKNGGPGAAANRALAACRGKYVALMTGDDLSVPERLQLQLEEYLRGEPRLLFSASDFIDEAGQPLDGGHFADGLFDTTPQTRAQIFRRFFDQGNFINGVTAFTETRLFREVGPYDPCLYQLQDYDMWIRFIKRYPITIQSQPLLHYRVRGDGGNLSNPTPGAFARHDLEILLIFRRFFADAPTALVHDAFSDRLVRPDLTSPQAADCEQALLLFHSPRIPAKLAGLEALHRLFLVPEAAALLEEAFAFPLQRFVGELTSMDLFDRYRECQTKLYLDTGSGFNEGETITVPAVHLPQFCVRFDLSAAPTVQGLRWDPVELRGCRVRLDRASWIDGGGARHDLAVDTLKCNGLGEPDGWRNFDIADPSFFLPVVGPVQSVVLTGHWEIREFRCTVSRVERLRQESEIALREANAATEEARTQIDLLHEYLTAKTKEIHILHEHADALTDLLDQTLDRRIRRWVARRLPGLLRLAQRWKHGAAARLTRP